MELRAERAAATRERIVDSAQALFVDPSAEFTLDAVASAAGVSVQTVLRAFGTKEALILAAIGTFRDREYPAEREAPQTISAAVALLIDDYEEIGDRVIRMLAEEQRIPGFAEGAAHGREIHREWITKVFGRYLPAKPARTRRRVLMSLLAATDVYIWKLLRRDLGLDPRETAAIVERLVRGALTDPEGT